MNLLLKNFDFLIYIFANCIDLSWKLLNIIIIVILASVCCLTVILLVLKHGSFLKVDTFHFIKPVIKVINSLSFMLQYLTLFKVLLLIILQCLNFISQSINAAVHILYSLLHYLLFLIIFFLSEHKSTKFLQLWFKILGVLLFLVVRQVMTGHFEDSFYGYKIDCVS